MHDGAGSLRAGAGRLGQAGMDRRHARGAQRRRIEGRAHDGVASRRAQAAVATLVPTLYFALLNPSHTERARGGARDAIPSNGPCVIDPPADGLSAAKRKMDEDRWAARPNATAFPPRGPLRSGRVCRPSIPIFGCGGPIPSPEYPNVKHRAPCLVPLRRRISSRRSRISRHVACLPHIAATCAPTPVRQ
jgi:hypothetical protein